VAVSTKFLEGVRGSGMQGFILCGQLVEANRPGRTVAPKPDGKVFDPFSSFDIKVFTGSEVVEVNYRSEEDRTHAVGSAQEHDDIAVVVSVRQRNGRVYFGGIA